MEIFPLCTGYSYTTLWAKNSLEIALSLTISEIFRISHFPLKSKMAAKSRENQIFSPRHRILLYYFAGQKFRSNPRRLPKVAKIEIFPLCIGYSYSTLWSKNSLEIALSLPVSRYSQFFIFR